MKAKNIFIVAAFLFTTLGANAQEISVIDVKRNITLSDDDVVYKDFYVNAGESSALRKNMIVNVKRKMNVKDASTKTIGDIEALVAQIKIIHVGTKVSVAREHRLVPRDEEPVLEQIGIMSGDRVDLVGAFIDNSKPVPKSKKAEVNLPSPMPTPVTKPEDNKTAEAMVEVPQI